MYTYRQDYRDSAGCIYMVIHLYVYVTTEVKERGFNLGYMGVDTGGVAEKRREDDSIIL